MLHKRLTILNGIVFIALGLWYYSLSYANQDSFTTGFSYPDAAAQSERHLIIPEKILHGEYEIINNSPWERKVLVASSEKALLVQ
ncbi:hypothetical protein TI05_04270 [Achromatium sp. WMS3]|nr:hypothetical protein TI05_04270 [Achromatium sp. WMS3]